MFTTTLTGLFLTAISIAILHAALPNHWLPVVLIARAHRWSRQKTLAIAAMAGLCHVISTTILGFLIAWVGWKLSEAVEGIVTPLAAAILVIFGMFYITFHFRHMGHHHGHMDEIPKNDKSAIFALLAILTFSPCEAVLPIFFAASPYGWTALIFLALILAVGTVTGMVLLTNYTYTRVEQAEFPWLEKHERVVLGSILIILGAIVMVSTEEWLINMAHQIPGIAYGIFRESWHVLRDASIYLLFGFLIAGLIRLLIPDEKVVKYLGGKGIKPVFFGSLFGIPIPLCSCGVIPTAIGLRKQGAGKGATLSFLVSTPETGIDSIAISYALLDPIMTIYRPIAAFMTAMITGITNNLFGKEENPVRQHNHEPGETCREGCSDKSTYSMYQHRSIVQKIGLSIRYAFVELLGDLAKWLVIGIFIAGFISFMIPDNFIQQYLGNQWIAMLVMLVVGIPLYVCATASTPIAAALILKGLSPGAALVFLLAGPATNAATITVVAKYFGKRSLAIYLGSIIICSLIMGFILNQMYFGLGINPVAVVGKAGELVSASWGIMGAWILLLLIPYAMYKDIRQKKQSKMKIIPEVVHEHSHHS